MACARLKCSLILQYACHSAIVLVFAVHAMLYYATSQKEEHTKHRSTIVATSVRGSQMPWFGDQLWLCGLIPHSALVVSGRKAETYKNAIKAKL
jgi:hypothetical protein